MAGPAQGAGMCGTSRFPGGCWFSSTGFLTGGECRTDRRLTGRVLSQHTKGAHPRRGGVEGNTSRGSFLPMGATMRLRILAAAILASGLAQPALAGDSGQWPTRFEMGNGVNVGLKGLLQYDLNHFTDDRLPDGFDRFDDAQTWRRQEFNLYVEKKGVFTVNAGYDFQADSWVDNYVGVETRAGRFRLGQFKTPVGWEDGSIATGNVTFMERSLPEQAVYEGRRVGLDWIYQGIPQWLIQVGFFTRHDLNDEAAGETFAGRVVYNPVLAEGDVVHLGLSASRELRDDRTGRIRARPEVNLTPVRLVDTGTLDGVDRLDREGLEAAWIHEIGRASCRERV